MIGRVRRHVTPAGVIAVFALVFAMTGGAYAAKRYLITSTSQISPKVLKSLKGAAGKNGSNGVAGANGATGPAGPTGPGGGTGAAGAQGSQGSAGTAGLKGEKGEKGDTGSPWPAGGTLPSNSTETGVWSARFEGVTEGTTISPISFAIPLKEGLGEAAKHYVTKEEQEKGTGPAACPGLAEEPAAAPGNLCLYQGGTEAPSGTTTLGVTVIAPPSSLGNPEGVGTSGAVAYVHYEGTSPEIAEIDGSWAVTAP